MPGADDPKTAFQSALNKITTAIENIIELKVRTIVGPVGAPVMEVETKVDLVQGDIVCNIPSEFFLPENDDLRAYHSEKEKQAQAIIDQNLDHLVSAAKALADALKD